MAKTDLRTPTGALYELKAADWNNLHDAVGVNVKDFGAVGNGVADDTAAIQAAITAAKASQARRSVFLPAGIYLISSGLSISQVRGISFKGAGSSATIIRVSGTITGPALDLEGVNTSDFGGFTIDCDTGYLGPSTFDIGIRYWWDNAGSSSYNNTFRDIQIWSAKFKIGIQIGSDASASHSGQEDQTYWYGCRVTGNSALAGSWDATWWQEGIRVGSGIHGNNLIHNFYGFGANACKYGVREYAGEAAFFGGIVQSNEIDWYFSATGPATKYWTVKGVRSEASGRFIGCSGSSGTQAQISFENCEFNCNSGYVNADRNIIDFSPPAVLRLTNITIGNNDAGYAPRIKYGGIHLIIDGMTVYNATATDLFVVSAGGATNCVTVRGLNIASSATGLITDYTSFGNTLRFVNQETIQWGLGPSAAADTKIERANQSAGYGWPVITGAKGIQLSGTSGPRWRFQNSVAADGVADAIGDIIWNTAPAAAGTLGWVYTAAGWKTFGAIAA